VRLRRSAFDDVVERQLALFASDESALLAEADEAEEAWIRAGREDAEEAYGDYQLVVDAIGGALHEIRETYAATLDGETADEYRSSFDRAARKRFGRLASFLEDTG